VTVQTDAISVELEKIVASEHFVSSPRMVRLLRFCVEESRWQRTENLKETVIGHRVFEREPGYDPKIDPIVRVSAGRMRERLEAYYSSVDDCEVVIQIPKGSYVAHFKRPESRTRVVFAKTAPIPVIHETRTSKGRLWLVALVTAIVALVAALRGRKEPPAATVETIVSLPGAANSPSWSPDGQKLAFTWDTGGSNSQRVFILNSGSENPVELTHGSAPEFHPVWAPDGRSVALLREISSSVYAIVVVDIESKKERLLRTLTAILPMPLSPALDWSSDGKWIVSSEQPQLGPTPAHLILISAQDGNASTLTDPPDASTGDLEAHFSPDGKQIAFRRGGQGDLFLLRLHERSASVPTQVTTGNIGVRGIDWSSDGKTIYFGGREVGSRAGIWTVPVDGHTPTRMTPPDLAAVSPAINKRQHLLAFNQLTTDKNLWLYSVNGGQGPRIIAPSRAWEFSPSYSPDGKQVAFVSNRSGFHEVWVAGVESGPIRQLTSHHDDSIVLWPSWSPDGTAISYYRRREGRNFAMEVTVATGRSTVLRESEDYTLVPQYTEGGRGFFFVSNMGRRFRLWHQRREFADSPEPVLPDTISLFRLAKDRKSIYFIRYRARPELIKLDLATRREESIWKFSDVSYPLDTWDISGQQFFYLEVRPTGLPSALIAVDLANGTQKSLGKIPMPAGDWPLGVTAAPDGQSAIVAQIDHDETRLMTMRGVL
jgi:Tol biopolymer transport system component